MQMSALSCSFELLDILKVERARFPYLRSAISGRGFNFSDGSVAPLSFVLFRVFARRSMVPTDFRSLLFYSASFKRDILVKS